MGGFQGTVCRYQRRPIQIPSGQAADYLGAWIGKLRDEYAATPATSQFGWYDKSFIIGERRIIPGQATLGKAMSRLESGCGLVLMLVQPQ